MHILTKSLYLAGLECPRYLWTKYHEKEKLAAPDASARFKLEQGTQVGQLAKKLFPNGLEVTSMNRDEVVQESRKLLDKQKPLFEPGFVFNNCYSRADILMPAGKKWDIVEVKSGTSIKEENLHDVTFQRHCYEGAGLKIGKCFILHLNTDYERQGKLDLEELFLKEDVTSQANKLQNTVKENINTFLEVINTQNYPETLSEPKCKSPKACPLDECWDFLPENHVFHLYRGGKIALQLFEEGIHSLADIPDDFELTDQQGIQRKCEKSNTTHIDKNKIQKFLDKLEYPLYYLDFETFSTAVPMFNGLRPHGHVPFQFSLHIVDKPGSKPKHHEYLYNGNRDPRKEFIEQLQQVLGNTGNIVVYNQSFESNILTKLAEHLPENKKWAENTNNRMTDLLTPFRDFSYYNPFQKGSASIKKVLPAITGRNYGGMEIADGITASVTFYNMAYNNGKDAKKDLLEYCKLDTLAEVLIINELYKLAK